MHTFIHTAQPNIMVSLLPQDHQTVCLGESISYNCAGNGTSIALNSPPIISESNPLTVLTRDGVEHCSVRANSAAGIILVDPTESSLFMVTFTLYVSDEQSEGERTVFCSVSSLDGMGTANTTFSVLGNVYVARVVCPCISNRRSEIKFDLETCNYHWPLNIHSL